MYQVSYSIIYLISCKHRLTVKLDKDELIECLTTGRFDAKNKLVKSFLLIYHTMSCFLVSSYCFQS